MAWELFLSSWQSFDKISIYSILLKSGMRISHDVRAFGVFVCVWFFSSCLPPQQPCPCRTVFAAETQFCAFLFNVVCDCPDRDGNAPKSCWIRSSWAPGRCVSCRCLLSEALFKIQGIFFVWLVIRSWISFVVASTIDHSESEEFYCSETNPRALLLVSVFFLQHVFRGAWNTSDRTEL